ncbi:hypothetical protein GCM10023149_48720 [Mucilaginibacter gynuensis]|uniref:Uncharacterized protein n=1 Tax=Mucilaginibacter gynuensis TaxID=1302236 RepID=A0ABP8HFE7_9SPHI
MENELSELKSKVIGQMEAFGAFDVPEGRHDSIIAEYYLSKGNNPTQDLLPKLTFIAADWFSFNAFLETQDRLNIWRDDAKRQAELEPKRTKTAIDTLTEMGYEVSIISSFEINFTHKGEVIKYYPYSGWASGKTIKDGRGFKNLIEQLKAED